MSNEKLQAGKSAVERFIKRFDPLAESYRALACHAALPFVLTPELLNYLRTEFLADRTDWVAEADLLLSDLCQEVGYEQFALRLDARAYLLSEMKATFGQERMEQVARRLLTWVRYLQTHDPRLRPHELKTQHWGAMVYLKERRHQAVQEMAAALKSGSPLEGRAALGEGALDAERLRVSNVILDLAHQLEEYQELVEYAELTTQILTDLAPSPHWAEKPAFQQPVVVAGVELPALRDWMPSKTLDTIEEMVESAKTQRARDDLATLRRASAGMEMLRGKANFEAGFFDKAEANFRTAVNLDLQSAEAWRRMAEAIRNNPDSSGVGMLLDLLSENDPMLQDPIVRRNLAEALGICCAPGDLEQMRAVATALTKLMLDQDEAVRQAAQAAVQMITRQQDRSGIALWYFPDDYDGAEKIASHLRDAGITPSMQNVEPIHPQVDALFIAMARGFDFALLFLSSRTVGMKKFDRFVADLVAALEERSEGESYVTAEAEDRPRLIPVRLDPCTPPRALRKLKVLDLYEPEGLNRLFDAIGMPRPSPPLTTFSFETVTLNVLGRVIKNGRRKLTARQYVEELAEGVPLEMVEIPGDRFLMGSPEGESGRWKEEGPQHEVEISSFFIGKYAVTQAQWRAVAGWEKVERDLEPDPSQFKGDARPVEMVSWEDAVEFCARLSKQTGRTYRLPTEAQWEYACRAGTATPFAFGATITPKYVNYNAGYPYGKVKKGKSRGETVEVGGLRVANAYGLFDMHGNVWEWCSDWYSDSYYDECLKQGVVTDPQGPSGGSYRVGRGGGWVNYAVDCRSADRSNGAPGNRDDGLGFRLVRIGRSP